MAEAGVDVVEGLVDVVFQEFAAEGLTGRGGEQVFEFELQFVVDEVGGAEADEADGADDCEQESVVGSACLELVGQVPPVPKFIDVVGPTGRLHEMRAAPEGQRLGIGTLLMDAVIEWAREQGYEGMILETTTRQEAAVEFDRTAGFVERGRSMIGRWELVWFEMRPLRGG